MLGGEVHCVVSRSLSLLELTSSMLLLSSKWFHDMLLLVGLLVQCVIATAGPFSSEVLQSVFDFVSLLLSMQCHGRPLLSGSSV